MLWLNSCTMWNSISISINAYACVHMYVQMCGGTWCQGWVSGACIANHVVASHSKQWGVMHVHALDVYFWCRGFYMHTCLNSRLWQQLNWAYGGFSPTWYLIPVVEYMLILSSWITTDIATRRRSQAVSVRVRACCHQATGHRLNRSVGLLLNKIARETSRNMFEINAT